VIRLAKPDHRLQDTHKDLFSDPVIFEFGLWSTKKQCNRTPDEFVHHAI